jgi:hypothetical protein
VVHGKKERKKEKENNNNNNNNNNNKKKRSKNNKSPNVVWETSLGLNINHNLQLYSSLKWINESKEIT